MVRVATTPPERMGRADDDVVPVGDDEAAEEVDAEADGYAGRSGYDNGLPLVGKVTQLDGGAHVHEQHGHEHAGDEQQRGVVEHGVREHLGPEAGQEDDRGQEEHRDDGLCLRGDHVANAEDEQDYECCKDR